MPLSPAEAKELQEKVAKLGPSGGPRPLAQAPVVPEEDLDPENLPEEVRSASERRCPFLQTFSEALQYDVDGLCDVRIQTFNSTPPYGPQSPDICQLCIRSKTFSLEQDKWDAMQAAAEQQIALQREARRRKGLPEEPEDVESEEGDIADLDGPGE